MNLVEKIEKELKNCRNLRADFLNWEEKTWCNGFRIGFKRGYALAYEEATEMLKVARRGV